MFTVKGGVVVIPFDNNVIVLDNVITSVVCEAMASRISDVAGIIDMDGFLISKRFYGKELGLTRVGDTAARSVFFDIEDI